LCMSGQEQTNRHSGVGVTIAICCHNSEKLLPATLARLRSQHVANGLRWEVVVIDNASTDRTALVARELWGDDGPAPLRVVCEPQIGLCYARERAFDEAQYEIVSFIDDDNWVNPEWIEVVIECMSTERELGAVGSVNTAVAEVPFPEWFSRYCQFYAAWAYRDPASPPATWDLTGAGMTIRKSVWYGLRQNGFKLQLTDRLGERLTSCGDLEIGCAIYLGGWKIKIEPRLRLQHYITPGRLQWRYLRRLLNGIGESWAALEAYHVPFQVERPRLWGRLRQHWSMRAAERSLNLISAHSWQTLIRCLFWDTEGDDEVVAIEFDIGRLRGLLRLRSRYAEIRREIALARWRRIDSFHENAATS
jgi:glycosyltransferase involved in cell wall biosynthesis